MNDRLAKWALALPEDVRYELRSVPGPGWCIWTKDIEDATPSYLLFCDASEAFTNDMWLPCDPCSVVEHVAKSFNGAPRSLHYFAPSGGYQAELLVAKKPEVWLFGHGATPIESAVQLLTNVKSFLSGKNT
jgi:hypothetical protein